METMPVFSSVTFSPESDAKTGWRKITVSITVLAADADADDNDDDDDDDDNNNDNIKRLPDVHPGPESFACLLSLKL